MKKILVFILLLKFGSVISQESTDTITFSFTDATPIEVIERIEEISDFRFQFVEDWLSNKTISGNYVDASLQHILDDLFKETVINYYILDGTQIILTRNNVIYDSLPEDFFDRKKETPLEAEETEATPQFYIEDKPTKSKKIETFRIGKERKKNRQRRYTLTGYARNNKKGTPIADLTIVVVGSGTGTSTDNNGFFKIDLTAGSNILEASALGIEKLRLRVVIYGDGQLNLNLNEAVETLDEVVVRGNRRRNIEQTVTGITQIKVEEIKTIPLVLGERDILKAAITLPGISNAGEGAAGYNVRGGRTDQNLILLDNAVIYNPSHFFGIFSALNPFTTGTVDIYKGSIPSEFGGRLSSVFDITTKDANAQKFSGEASIGPVTGNLMLEIPIVKDKSAILLGGRGTYSEWILRSLDDEDLNKSTASFYDFVTKYNHRINEKNDLKATGYFSRDAFSITSDSLFTYSNRLLSLKWDHRFNPKNSGSLMASNSEYKFNIEFDGDATNDFDLGYKINETEIKLNMRYTHNKKHTFGYGVSGKLYEVAPGSIKPTGSESILTRLDIPRERAFEGAIFLSDKYMLDENILIDAGLRYSFYAALGESQQRVYQDNAPKNEGTFLEVREFYKNEFIKTYGGPELRISGRYLLGNDFSIKAGYNNTFQYIHTLSNNTTVSPTDTWKLSDLNIEPQRANQISLGFYKNFSDNVYELSLEGYYKKSRNILDYKVGAQLLLNETIETEVLQGDGRAFGLEFLIKKLEGRLNGWLGYTYSRSFIRLDSEFNEERVNAGDYFPSNFDRPHDVSLVANYKFTKRFSASANVVYQTGRPVTFPVGSYDFNNSEFVFFSNRNEFRIPDFYRLDLSFNMEGNHKIKKFAHSFWNFSIYNVLGRNNPYSVFFVTENGEIKAYQSSIFAIPVPTITYNFKF